MRMPMLGNHIISLRRHARAVIHEDANCNRDIFVTEISDLLECPVFINLKIVSVEAGDGRVLSIEDCCTENYQIRVKPEGVLVA